MRVTPDVPVASIVTCAPEHRCRFWYFLVNTLQKAGKTAIRSSSSNATRKKSSRRGTRVAVTAVKVLSVEVVSQNVADQTAGYDSNLADDEEEERSLGKSQRSIPRKYVTVCGITFEPSDPCGNRTFAVATPFTRVK